MGRDLVLGPAQAGKPLNYLMYPYAEVGGQPLDWHRRGPGAALRAALARIVDYSPHRLIIPHQAPHLGRAAGARVAPAAGLGPSRCSARPVLEGEKSISLEPGGASVKSASILLVALSLLGGGNRLATAEQNGPACACDDKCVCKTIPCPCPCPRPTPKLPPSEKTP